MNPTTPEVLFTVPKLTLPWTQVMQWLVTAIHAVFLPRYRLAKTLNLLGIERSFRALVSGCLAHPSSTCHMLAQTVEKLLVFTPF